MSDKYKCNFIKEYQEPDKKYNVFSFSVFYMAKYIRFYKNYSKDITEKRQSEFLYNLTLNIQNLEQGFFGDNWYIRIFYDKSLFNFKIGKRIPWMEFMMKHKKNKFLQFVQFRCEHFVNKYVHSAHINLFGTLSRLYPIFEKNDLLETIVVFDADNIITSDYFDEIVKFKKSKYDYNSFGSKYEFSYYKDDNAINKDNCYIRCGMLAVNKKLPENLWNYILYQLKTFEDKEFADLVNKLFEYHTTLMPEKKIKTYKQFEYGMDEIVLNYYVKKFFNDANYKMRVVRYRPMIMAIINCIIIYLKYNHDNNKKDIVKQILMNILNNNYTGNLTKDLDIFNKMYYTNITFHTPYNKLKPYIDILRKEYKLFEELNLPKVILNFIKNVSSKDYDNVTDFDKFFYSYTLPMYFK